MLTRLLSFLKRHVIPFGISIGLVVLIDIFSNNVTKEFLFDSRTYIEMAERGFAGERISAFIYRFVGPFLAAGLHRLLGLSLYRSFKLITYVGAIGQLFGVFLLVEQFAKSKKSAYVGMLVVAFSLFNVKYLLYDVYRPDTLAYPVILICIWLSLNDYFFSLLITTMIGLQIREFTIVPLLAYLAVKLIHNDRKTLVRNVLISAVGLFVAIGVPRLLISVEGHIEAVELSLDGIGQAIHLISIWTRNVNIGYIVLAYFLPFLIFYSAIQIKTVFRERSLDDVTYLLVYSCAVLLLIFIGGTDLDRFATYFAPPLAILTGLLAKNQSFMKILLVLSIQILFNRIWLPFPVWDINRMIDFYAGWSDVINIASLWRFAELITLIVIGRFIVHFRFPEEQKMLPGE